MTRLAVTLCLALAVLTAGSCDREDGDWGSSVRGHVIDSVTETALAGVMVYRDDTTSVEPFCVTDSLGAFSLASFGYWESACYFKRDGYATKAVTLGTESTRGDVTGVVIRLSQ